MPSVYEFAQHTRNKGTLTLERIVTEIEDLQTLKLAELHRDRPCGVRMTSNSNRQSSSQTISRLSCALWKYLM